MFWSVDFCKSIFPWQYTPSRLNPPANVVVVVKWARERTRPMFTLPLNSSATMGRRAAGLRRAYRLAV